MIRDILFPKPVFWYPKAIINAVKINHITVFEKPERAHDIFEPNLLKAYTAENDTPANPINAKGQAKYKPVPRQKNSQKRHPLSFNPGPG